MLQQPADFHVTLPFLLARLGSGLLTLLCKQLGVVPSELLQRDQEVTQDDLLRFGLLFVVLLARAF